MKNLKSAILALSLTLGVVAPTFATNSQAVVVEQDATKKEITMKDLPATIVEDVKTNHADAKFVSAVKWVNADETVKGYDVVLQEGDKEVTLSYDAKGVALKK